MGFGVDFEFRMAFKRDFKVTSEGYGIEGASLQN